MKLNTPEHEAYRAKILAYGAGTHAVEEVRHLEAVIDDLQEDLEAHKQLVRTMAEDAA